METDYLGHSVDQVINSYANVNVDLICDFVMKSFSLASHMSTYGTINCFYIQLVNKLIMGLVSSMTININIFIYILTMESGFLG